MKNTRSNLHDIAGPALTIGCMTAVVMWCVWYVTHLPTVQLAAAPAAGLILLALALGLSACGFWTDHPRHRLWLVGMLAGAVCGLLNLLVLGSFLAQPGPDVATPAPGMQGLRPTAVLFVPGFLIVTTAVGGVAAIIGRQIAAIIRQPTDATLTDNVTDDQRHNAQRWLSRFAAVTALSIFPLLLVGGAVTSTRSGLAVPDWPGTYGANMFLYPIALMAQERTPEIFYEHSHRLLGALVGLVSLSLFIFSSVSPAGREGRARLWTLLLFLAIGTQGLLGAARVLEGSPMLGVLHGVAAQLIFAFAVAIAVWLSPVYRDVASGRLDIEPHPRDRRAKFFTTGLFHALILQLILGAAVRHFRHAGSPGAMHALWTHAAFALVVVVFALAAGYTLMGGKSREHPARRSLPRAGLLLTILVGLQFVIGWIALFIVLHAPDRGPVPTSEQLAEAVKVGPAEAIITTLHQVNGALLLAVATFCWTWLRRIHRATRAK